MHFAKDGKVNHRLVSREGEVVVATVQEYMPKWMRPWVHELKVTVKETEGEGVKREIEMGKGQIEVEYDQESNCLIRIKDIRIPANSEVFISFGFRKILLPFEEYPNDPNRGFNIP
jgi:Gpi16 subunit, GPI transamidase component